MTSKNNRARKVWAFALLALIPFFAACAGVGYSFTGSSLDPSVKTITIKAFESQTSYGPANMEILFTQKLRRHFQRNTRLTLVPEGGDLLIEGSISSYTIQPVASGGGGTQAAELQRLTIAINVNFANSQNEVQNFQSSFSNSEDATASEDFSAVERKYMEKVFDNIVNDIFNKTVADW